MSDHIKTLSTVAAVTLSALSASPALAGQVSRAAAVYVPAVIGAGYNDASRADSVVDLRRQGGFATVGTVRWLAQAPAAEVVAQPVVHVPSVIGAMSESRSLARSAEEVRQQGGFATAGTVRFLAKAPATEVASQPVYYVPSVIGAMTESRIMARSAEDVRSQGGFATAGTVRFLAKAPEAENVAAF